MSPVCFDLVGGGILILPGATVYRIVYTAERIHAETTEQRAARMEESAKNVRAAAKYVDKAATEATS